MNKELIERLSVITDEERELISGGGLDKSLYSDSPIFKVESEKMLQKGKLFTIRPATRFVAFPEHGHNYVEIIYMCKGSQKHIIDGKTEIVLGAGELLLLNQNSRHSTSAAGKDDIAINMVVLPQFFNTALQMIGEDNKISRFLFSGLAGKGHTINFLHFNVADVLQVQNLIENLIWSVVFKQQNRRNINQITMGLLFLQLLGLSDRLISDEEKSLPDKIIMAALGEIENNYQTASLNTVALSCNVSPAYVSSTVKAITGRTFKEHLVEKRLLKAAELLSTTQISVNNIIFMVGYENTSYFHRMFAEHFGISPKEYREKKTSKTHGELKC